MYNLGEKFVIAVKDGNGFNNFNKADFNAPKYNREEKKLELGCLDEAELYDTREEAEMALAQADAIHLGEIMTYKSALSHKVMQLKTKLITKQREIVFTLDNPHWVEDTQYEIEKMTDLYRRL